jgi:hypothetical protein
LNEKQSLSHFFNCCSDNITENEVAQEELNTGPTTPYYTFVFIHDSRNRKTLHSQCSGLERETVVLSLFNWCSDNIAENEVAQEELNTCPTTPYYTFVFLHGGRNRKTLHSQWSRLERETVVKSLFKLLQ